MGFVRVLTLLVATVVVSITPTPVHAENSFFIPPTEIRGLANNEEIFVHMDNDVELTALSFSIRFDPLVVQVVSIEPAGVTISAEWESGGSGPGQVDNLNGELVYGIATEFDFAELPDNVMPIGSDQTVARIVVNTLADSRTTTVFEFVNGLGSSTLGSRNTMVDTLGNSINPTLSVESITIDPLIPILSSFQDNSGPIGTSFLVIGRHFEQSGLQVTVCGNPASVTVNPGGFTMTVTAPTCDSIGNAIVEACNDFGCASDATGFNYEDSDFRRSDVDNNGTAGINDALLIMRYLFVGDDLNACQDAADVNDDGTLNIGDPMRLLFFLFATALPPSSPYPLVGSDPTPDGLSPCI
jgi:hypothetical protein